MIFAIVFIFFFASVIFTGVAITMEKWPRVVVAFGGVFTGLSMIPAIIQMVVLLRG